MERHGTTSTRLRPDMPALRLPKQAMSAQLRPDSTTSLHACPLTRPNARHFLVEVPPSAFTWPLSTASEASGANP
eukprot:11899785-Alexandrium_andersonii.AAC.1